MFDISHVVWRLLVRHMVCLGLTGLCIYVFER